MQEFDLKAFRKKENLTQKELYQKTGIPQPTIAGIETGRSKLSDDINKKIRAAFPDTDFSPFEIDPSTVQESSGTYEGRASHSLQLLQQTMTELYAAHAENVNLLREIISLKDELAHAREELISLRK